jgi:hypothetical protein
MSQRTNYRSDDRLPRRPIAGWLLTAVAALSGSVNADPLVESILNRVYNGYDQKGSCWRYRSDSPGGYCCLKIDRQDRVETASGPRLYLLLAGGCYDRAGEREAFHVSAGMIGAFVLGVGQDGAKMLAGNPGMPLGSWGNPPTDWTLVELGPSDYWGWLATSDYFAQGRADTWQIILAPYKKTIRDLGGKNRIKSGISDGAACAEAELNKCRITALETKLEIDTSQSNARVFPLRLTVTGQLKGQSFAPKTWTFPFDTKSWTYVQPSDWPFATE